MSNIDVYVRDKDGERVHRVGESEHDSLYVQNGIVFYYNLQNGCGTLPEGNGTYEFVSSECGEVEETR